MNRVVQFSVRLVERYLPDPFVLVMQMVLILVASGIVIGLGLTFLSAIHGGRSDHVRTER